MTRWKFLRLTLSIAVLLSGNIAHAAKLQTDNRLALNVDDLGFQKNEIKSDPVLQYRIEKRSNILQIHQKLGIITALAMLGTFLNANDVSESASSRKKHMMWGLTTSGLYFTTASFALFAPEVDGVKHSGATKWHRNLAFIHFPAMLLIPIMGLAAKRQEDRGESIHGIAKYHTTAVGAALASFSLSIAIISINF